MIDRHKLPIDLADDEILNPSKRIPIIKKEPEGLSKSSKAGALSNIPFDKKVVLQNIKKNTDVCSLSKEQILTASKKNKLVHNECKNSDECSLFKKTEEKFKNKKLIKEDIKDKFSSNILTKRKFLNESDNLSSNISINKFDKKLVDLYNYKKKQDRLGQLNASARALAEINQEIAEKEQALRELINDSKNPKIELKNNEELHLKKPINSFVKKSNDAIWNVSF